MHRTILPVAAAAITFSAFAAFAQTPTPAQQQAIKSNCVADYRANCSGVPTGGMDALICLEQHEAKLSPACKSAVEAVDHHTSSTASTAAPAAAGETAKTAETEAVKPSAGSGDAKASGDVKTEASAPAATGTGTAPASGKAAMSLRQEMRLAARACARDYRALCPNLPAGQGNVLFCLKVHEEHLSPRCRQAILDAGEVF